MELLIGPPLLLRRLTWCNHFSEVKQISGVTSAKCKEMYKTYACLSLKLEIRRPDNINVELLQEEMSRQKQQHQSN